MATAWISLSATYPRDQKEETVKPTCNACAMDLVAIAPGVLICPRCDTVAQGNGMRSGPPKLAGTRDGWFNAPFGDKW